MENIKLDKFSSHDIKKWFAETGAILGAILPFFPISVLYSFYLGHKTKRTLSSFYTSPELVFAKEDHPVYKSIEKIKKRTSLTNNIKVFETTDSDYYNTMYNDGGGTLYIGIHPAFEHKYSQADWDAFIAHELSHAYRDSRHSSLFQATMESARIIHQRFITRCESLLGALSTQPIVQSLPGFMFDKTDPIAITAAIANIYLMKGLTPLSSRLSDYASRQNEMATDELALQLTDKPDDFRNFMRALEQEKEALASGWKSVLKAFKEAGEVDIDIEEDLIEKMFPTKSHPAIKDRIENIDSAIKNHFGKQVLTRCIDNEPEVKNYSIEISVKDNRLEAKIEIA